MASKGWAIAAAIIIIIIIIGVAAYYMTQKPAPTTTTPTTASTTSTTSSTSSASPTTSAAPAKPVLTGNFEKDVIAIGKYLESKGIHTVKFTVWATGDPNSVMRMYGLYEAAYRINKIWEKNGINVKIVMSKFWESSFKKLYDEFLSAVPQGTNGDFFVNSYIYIANLASQGYILNINSYVEKYWNSVFKDFYPALMNAAKYKGQYYAVPQDTEARPIYVRKDVAACMGWDISNLAQLVKEGKFTWHDMFKKAEEAVSKGCAKWGLIHRKGSAHPDLMQFIFAYGGKLYDPKTGKLVFDVPAVYKWFATEYAFAQHKLLPKDMMSWDWAQQIHPTVVNDCKGSPTGCTLFFIGGTWHWTEWQTKAYYYDPHTHKRRPLTPEEEVKKFYYMLFPAGDPGDKPVTLSQPFMWMIAENAGKDNPDYNQLKDVYHELAFLMIVKASDPEINAIHSVISGHVPVRKAAAALLKNETWINDLINMKINLSPEVKKAIEPIVKRTASKINIEFLANVSYMLEYTHLAPSHPQYPKLAGYFADAINKVLMGSMTPKEAVNYMIQKIKADPDLSKAVEIVGSIPTNWTFP